MKQMPLTPPARRDDQWRRLVASIEDYAIFLVDPTGRVASWNSGAGKISGYAEAEIVGLPLDVFYPPEDRGRCAFLLARAERDGRVRDEGWRQRKGGARYWADVAITALRNEEGELTGFAEVTRDITERKEALDLVSAQAEALRRSNEELEQFALIASHDLQAPLRKINAFGEVLETRTAGRLEGDAADALHRMRRAAVGMADMIQDLLDLARIGQEERFESSVALGPIVKNVVSMLEPVIRDSNAVIEAGALPAVRGDRLQLRRLVQNLLDNALKFRRKNTEHRVSVAGVPDPESGMCAFEISDNGIGFSTEDFERMRRPFERLNSSVLYEGAGMGLAICNKIVARHNGTLEARSMPGKGSVIRVRLPMASGRRNGKK